MEVMDQNVEQKQVEQHIEVDRPNEPKKDEDVDFIRWQQPVIPERILSGRIGPQHTLDPFRGVPFDYFCLFIPLFFYTRIAEYTNIKAEIEAEKKDGKVHVRDWTLWIALLLKFCCQIAAFKPARIFSRLIQCACMLGI
jgi:hypothetical protein